MEVRVAITSWIGARDWDGTQEIFWGDEPCSGHGYMGVHLHESYRVVQS